MSVWRIQGGEKLEGRVPVQGSKNAVLPVLAAAILTDSETELTNVPALRDVDASLHILRKLGCRVARAGDRVLIDAAPAAGCELGRDLTGQMRSSVIFLGAVLARFGRARIALPGGCELGPRPVDLHLQVMRALGAHAEMEDGDIVCRADKLRGAHIGLPFPSVGATENAMIAACAAEGTTVIHGAAREPEIVELQGFLRAMGAVMSGAGTDRIVIDAFRPQKHVTWSVMPDRIGAATLLCACACAGGDVELLGPEPAHIAAVTDALSAMGARLDIGDKRVRIACQGRLAAPGRVVTRPYPGFPTDAQPLMMAAALTARGGTVFEENIFDRRFRHASQMVRMGADIRTVGRLAVVRGVERLHGAHVLAEDLRGGAALILAGLGAEGETVVEDPGHVDRGYESLDGALAALGAHIEKT